MEEAPENGKESPHSVHANGLIDIKHASVMVVPSISVFSLLLWIRSFNMDLS